MKRSFFFPIILLIFFSCHKEISNEFVPDPGNPYNDTSWTTSISANAPVNEIFQLLSKPSETNSLDAAAGGTVNFNNGIQVTLPSKACGEGLSGNMKIDVDFLGTKGDMIRFGKPTMSGNQLLISGGAFHIHVSQNASQLSLKEDKTIVIKYRSAHPATDMKVFYGDTSVNSREGFTWIPANDRTSSVRPVRQGDTAYFYQVICKKFEWVNCDKFFNGGGERTKVSVILPVNFTNKNTAVFLVSKDQFMVARCRTDEQNRLFFIENMPTGNAFTIVTVSKIGNDLYLGTKDITVSKNLNVELSPGKKNQQEIDDYLNSL
jgi:hypothetical protein